MDLPRYHEAREELIATAVPGIDPARQLSRLTDEMLTTLAHEAAPLLPARTKWALIALGGYGSGALLPGSDLDLLIASNATSQALKPFVEAILYPLWDCGLKVGHQVRSTKEQVRAVREDLATLTATLTGRAIVGNDRLATDLLRTCASDALKRRKATLTELQSRERPGSPYLLEPDLKEGAGGRRDYDELTWTAAILTGAPQGDPLALVSLGMLSANAAHRLENAANTIAAARWELQLASVGSLMSLDAAQDLRTNPQDVQRALADTHHLLLETRAKVEGHDSPPRTPISSHALLSLAALGETSVGTLEHAAWSGRLDPLIPGFGELLALRRPGLAHTLTVGAHCLKAATLLPEIGNGLAGEIATRSAHSLDDLSAVTVAALIHDIGKEVPGPGHAARGAETARSVARVFGLDDQANDIASLVELHLLLAETASSEDLDDEDAILRAAALIGDRSLLAPLHLLTIADSIATGPGAWTDWHEALIGKLVMRLDVALSPEIDGAGLARAAEETRAAAASSVPAQSREAHFITHAPVRYLADRDPTEVVRHSFLVAGLAADRTPGAHETEIAAGPLPGSYRVTIAAPDRPGLFSLFAGCFALSGLDILGVQAVTIPGGIVLDTFTVQSATRATIGGDTWSGLERSLSSALRNRLAIGVRLAERQRHYRQEHREAPHIAVDASDPYAAVIRVSARDRLGLLYDVSRAIADSELNIIGVTATSRDDRAIDTFRVIDRDGQVPPEGLLGHLKMRLRELG